MSSNPKISVVTANRNGGRFLRETIESVMVQRPVDFEHVIVDGASTDDSVDILKSYPHLVWKSEPDRSPTEGFRKALAMARGEYVMVTCASDGYLSRTWFQRCAEVLDRDPEVSIVWGLALTMNEGGDLDGVWQHALLTTPPPQKQGFLEHWLATGLLYPELNYCIRRDVFLRSFPAEDDADYLAAKNPFVQLVFNLNVNGYLPYFLPYFAHFGRAHHGQYGERIQDEAVRSMEIYQQRIADYRDGIASGRIEHIFRDGKGAVVGPMSAEQLARIRVLDKAMKAGAGQVMPPTNEPRRPIKRLLRRLRGR